MEMEENLEQSIKYIVYLTINKVNKKIYVGVHKTINNQWDYYLGNGVFANKPDTYKKSKTIFQYAVNKYGPDSFIRTTIYEFDNEDEAYAKEAEIVNENFLKRKDVYNMTLGGNKPPVRKMEIHQYDLDGNYIKSYDSIKDACLENNIKMTNIGFYLKEGKIRQRGKYLWSFDKVDKLDPIKYNNPRKVGVYKDGKLIKIYNTVRDCKKDYCGCVHVLKGTRQFCKGCTFKYLD